MVSSPLYENVSFESFNRYQLELYIFFEVNIYYFQCDHCGHIFLN